MTTWIDRNFCWLHPLELKLHQSTDLGPPSQEKNRRLRRARRRSSLIRYKEGGLDDEIFLDLIFIFWVRILNGHQFYVPPNQKIHYKTWLYFLKKCPYSLSHTEGGNIPKNIRSPSPEETASPWRQLRTPHQKNAFRCVTVSTDTPFERHIEKMLN